MTAVWGLIRSAIVYGTIIMFGALGETLTEKSYEVFGKIYQQQQQQGQQPPHAPNDGTSYGPNEGGDDNVVDADYEVVK